MIKPPAEIGVAFSGAEDGDLRADTDARSRFSASMGISPAWATVSQVHGSEVVSVGGPGPAGEADAIWTTMPGLPLAIFTADCLGVVVHAGSAVGVAHAGWRGTTAGVVPALVSAMASAGHPVGAAFIGPGIGPCCFEVGPEVSDIFTPEHRSTTTWETESIDLIAATKSQLPDIPIWSASTCTMHDRDWFSHRRDGTKDRQVALGWLT